MTGVALKIAVTLSKIGYGPLIAGLRRVVQQRLVRLAQRVLQRVEHLGELEAQEALGVEERDAVAARRGGELAQGHLPEAVHRGVAGVHVRGEAPPARRPKSDCGSSEKWRSCSSTSSGIAAARVVLRRGLSSRTRAKSGDESFIAAWYRRPAPGLRSGGFAGAGRVAAAPQAAASAWSRSASRSSMCSMPTDSRTMSALTPAVPVRPGSAAGASCWPDGRPATSRRRC